MELTKFVLMMFIWPAGQAEDKPLWTNDAFSTTAECEAGAIEVKAAILKKYGADAGVEHYCISIDDRIDEHLEK